MTFNNPQPVSGFTCSGCGAWVPDGSFHYCPNMPSMLSNNITWMQANRIIELLENILKKLEERTRYDE
jgi:hypothetical protein